MRILYFTDTFFPQINGVTNTLGYLSRYLQDHNIQHLFVAPSYEAEGPESSELPVVRFKGFAPSIYPECRLSFPAYRKIRELVTNFQPDLIHIVTEFGIGYTGLRVARDLGLPIIMSYHTSYDKYLDFYNLKYIGAPVWSYVRWFHSFAAVNLCPSENTLAALSGHGLKNLSIWSRGIDATRFSPSYYSQPLRESLGCKDKTAFLYVGRIAREKGLDVLAESIKQFNRAHGDSARFIFTGDGPYLEDLKAHNFPNAVFTGPLRGPELSAVYASCDAFVFPSGSETFGNVMLEAMASGLPGICTDAGGVTDFTAHGENAYVCRYRDTAGLTTALHAMTDPAIRNAIRSGALKTAHQRSWGTIFDGLCGHYLETLKQPSLVFSVAV